MFRHWARKGFAFILLMNNISWQKVQFVMVALGALPIKQLFCPELYLVNDPQQKRAVKQGSRRRSPRVEPWKLCSQGSLLKHAHSSSASKLAVGGFTFPLEASLKVQRLTLLALGFDF